MYYIFKNKVALYEHPQHGVSVFALPHFARAAESLKSRARNRYIEISTMTSDNKKSKKERQNKLNSIKRGLTGTEDFLLSEQIPLIEFFFGRGSSDYKVSKEDFDNFINTIKEHENTQRLREVELGAMSYPDLVQYIQSFPLSSETRDLLFRSVSQLTRTSETEPSMDNRKFLEIIYSILKGVEESGDLSVISDLATLSNISDELEYIQSTNNEE